MAIYHFEAKVIQEGKDSLQLLAPLIVVGKNYTVNAITNLISMVEVLLLKLLF